MPERPFLHILLMGESGHGKDTFASTFPGPRMVWHLDGHGQEMPYRKGAQQDSGLLEYRLGDYTIPYRDVVAKDGSFTRIEYYSSDDPRNPVVAGMLETRMGYFSREQDQWKTLVCGSLSSAALENRLYEQFVLNPGYKDPRKWYGAATEYVERLILGQKALRLNVIFICHIGRTQDEVGGELMFTPDLPGRLSYGAGRYFNEIYRAYVVRDPQGAGQYVLQTNADGRYIAKTHIDAPNPCWPQYDQLWGEWDRQHTQS